MTLNEIATLFRLSRREIMRRVEQRKLPQPTNTRPLSWDDKEIRLAYKRTREEKRK